MKRAFGYIGTRPLHSMFDEYPQRVQGLVIRDYAKKIGVSIGLSVTEYVMDDSLVMLTDLTAKAGEGDVIILFSIDMLPRHAVVRENIIKGILDKGIEVHSALEHERVQLERLCDVLNLQEAIDGAR